MCDTKNEQKLNETDDGLNFDPGVLKEELKQILLRRIARRQEDQDPNKPEELDKEASVLAKAREWRLMGLALSGGGIRSATFNLGVLQGLAKLGLLGSVDYLSTVSGGGYIGGWLAAWIYRDGFDNVAKALQADTTANQPGANAATQITRDPIGHLRRYSNYLAPRAGFLSADRWVLWSNYLRNFLLNQMVLLPLLILFLLLVRFGMWFYYPWSPDLTNPRPDTLILMNVSIVIFVGIFILSLTCLLHGARMVQGRNAFVEDYDHSRWTPGRLSWPILGFVLCAFLFCAFVPYPFGDTTTETIKSWFPAWISKYPQLTKMVCFALPTTLLSLGCYLVARFLPPQGPDESVGGHLVAVLSAGFVGGCLLCGVYFLLGMLFTVDGPEAYVRAAGTAWSITVGPPLVLLSIVVGMSVGVGLLKDNIRPELREWWASIGARLLVWALLWFCFFFVALHATVLVLWAGPTLQTALTSSWVLSVIAGVLAGGGPRTGPARSNNRILELLAWLGPYFFLVGMLVGASVLMHHAFDYVPRWEEADDDVWLRKLEPKAAPIVDTVRQEPDGSGPKETRVVEYREVASEEEIVQQMYWIGFINPGKTFVPKVKVKGYDLVKGLQEYDKYDKYFENHGEKLNWGKGNPRDGLDKEKFETELITILNANPERSRQMLRLRLTQYAKNVAWFDDSEEKRWQIPTRLGWWAGGCLSVMLLAMWRVDVNLMSLHSVYGNRLVRSFLGASRPKEGPRQSYKRQPDPVTTLDPNDDLLLEKLQQGEGQPDSADGPEAGYSGPYTIINAALNQVGTARLDHQERKAESFTFAPLFCGSEETTCYRPTKPDVNSNKAYGGRMWLGTAITLSGAAASPNMGYHSSPVITALLTIFNARLGGWLGNPKRADTWNTNGPRLGFWHLFLELFGLTDSNGAYIFLSDGGHFENLGAYELVRRRCKYVIVSDASHDPFHTFDDLSNLVHKCRVDFGIEIQIAPDSLRPSEKGICSWHCALGQIRYDLVDPDASPGILVYLKPSLTGDEPTDVLQYRERNPAFPHDSTSNQFFTEMQFESYRVLGKHIAESVFEPAKKEADADEERNKTKTVRTESAEARHRSWHLNLFSALVRKWYALPPTYDSSFIQSTRGFMEIQTALRNKPRLWRLSLDIYPELDPDGAILSKTARKETPKEALKRRTEETHLILQMFQVMENAWISLKLESHYAHPLNRGWLDVFHRWTNAPTVRELWSALRAEFARDFVGFCEKQMNMGPIEAIIERIPRQDKDGNPMEPPGWERFSLELKDQIPVDDKHPWDWHQWYEKARESEPTTGWYIYPKNSYPGERAAPKVEDMPCGIILLHPTKKKGVTELFIWMRGAYRNSGLGRLALREVLDTEMKKRTEIETLQARLPTADLSGPGGKVQESMWLTFFFLQGFTRVPKKGDEDDKCIVLQWKNAAAVNPNT